VASISGTVRTLEPIRHLHGDPATSVHVEANVDDTYFATVTCQNGALAQLLFSWGGHGEATAIPGGPVFYGSKGCIKSGEIILDDGRRQNLAMLFTAQADKETMQKFFPNGFDDPFVIQQWDWLQAIEGGAQPETDGREGLHDLAAAFAMIESSHLGRTVTLAEILSGEVDGYQREINEFYGIGE
jgi:predicted dehydrogenase